MKLSRIRFKTILKFFIVVIIGVMTLMLVVVLNSNKYYSTQLNKDLNQLVMLQTSVDKMDELTELITNYVVSGDEDYLNEYNELSREMQAVTIQYQNISEKKARYYLYYDLNNIILSYTEQVEKLVEIYHIGRGRVYIDDEINELRKNNIFVKEQLSSIIFYELSFIKQKYGNIEKESQNRDEIIYFIIFLVIVITLGLGTLIANLLAKPIHNLSIALSLIGKGEYDMPPLTQNGTGEVYTIIEDFNKMQVRLKENIGLIHENARMKEQLKNSEIELLEKENYLKQSRLDFLQAQINPHFLYNTLNSIQTLADIEEAPSTERMLSYLSSLMRYNVKKINTTVHLREEIEVIENYVHIQLIRFGNRIKYQVDCDEESLRAQVPSMILQPIVENAMIHGLEPKLGEGLLEIRAKKTDRYIELMVSDNGAGMDEDIIRELLAYGEGKTDESNHLTKNVKSIGVANVIRRCKLFYGENIIVIDSKKDEYTRFIFRLPVS